MNTDNPILTPWKHGSLTLKNRVVMAPMTRQKSPGGVPGADVARYYERRAQGGVGLIITEGTAIDHPAANGYPDVPYFYGENALAGWREVVRAVHGAGGKIMPQLWHVGAVRKPGTPPDPAVPGYSPAGMLKPGGKVVGHAMTESDIGDVVASFARAAADAKRVGFDGVELHGAHGYLLDQFFWEGTNPRTDAYGGSIEARARIGVEAVRAVRAAVGPDYPVMLRFSQWKQQDYTAKLALDTRELERFLKPFVDAGVTLFHASTRRFYEPEFEGSNLNLAGHTQKITGVPTVSVGSVGLDTEFTPSAGEAGFSSGKVHDLGRLYERMARKEFDLVAVGRALIADAELVNKLAEGREGEIRGFDRKMLLTLD
jgi:2,4-dienoyl-CoA reductase-like NADH-dependent reductase (Old Yellow Enzyme family)